ncbi:MAG TPA: hypothetical protein VE978_16810 [Chitinophagales bacterium]|nr:hypothetical protein [Chitinophagales bacterium]
MLPENFRKNFFVLLCGLCTAEAVSAQYYLFNPKYKWSIGIEHSNTPVIFTQHDYLPDNIEISQWIAKHRYWQVGVIYVPLTDETTQTDTFLNIKGDTISKPIYFQSRFAIYGGYSLKLYMGKRMYFTPSLNLYIEDFYYDTDNWALAVGPTTAFEYFFTNHFSLRLDLFNFNFALSSSGNFLVTLHRVIGMGVRYNFSRK